MGPHQVSVSVWQGAQDFADELAFGYGAHNLYPVVDDGLGHVHHGIRLRETGNSLASITSAVIRSQASAIRWARLATWGQCGQVGVTNTWRWSRSSVSASAVWSRSRVVALNDGVP